MFQSKDSNFNKVKSFHAVMDGDTQETPKVYDWQSALFRAGFKVEELVEFLHATSESEEIFQEGLSQLHRDLDKAAQKISDKRSASISLQNQVDALLDILYFTYGSFVLMGSIQRPFLPWYTLQIWEKFFQMERRILIRLHIKS